MFKTLKINGVGPVPNLEANFGSRTNVLTGDNGLGKSFLLDMIFWALTETWPQNRLALPEIETESASAPTISWELAGKNDFSRKELASFFDFSAQSWIRNGGRHAPKSLVIYAAQNSFAVWDPARNWTVDPNASASGSFSQPGAYQFDADSLANGLKEHGRSYCNGLIHDWVNWYYHGAKPGGSPHFKQLEMLIELLSPPDMPLRCAAPRNVFAGDTREFPTLKMPYGEIAYPHWPAGIKRIIGLAYLIVWAWQEHLRAARQRRDQPASHIILLVDDIESNLSPQWQRTILHALSQTAEMLDPNTRSQLFLATHSPLVLASLEPHYDERCDLLFWFKRNRMNITFQELPWVRHGDVNTWLMSIIFNLKQPRSVEAEAAVIAAIDFLNDDKDRLPAALNNRALIEQSLEQHLPAGDGFLEYWKSEAKSAEAIVKPESAA